jgi:hypothetical protein
MKEAPKCLCYSIKMYIYIIIMLSERDYSPVTVCREIASLWNKGHFSWCISWHEKLHLQQTFMFWIICIQDAVDLKNCLNKSSKWDVIHLAFLKEVESGIIKPWAKCIRWLLFEKSESWDCFYVCPRYPGIHKGSLDPEYHPSTQENGIKIELLSG